VVNGNQSAATNLVTVESSGTLGGNGIVGGNAVVNGTLAPGASIGTLTFNQNLTLTASAIAQFEISKSPFANDVVLVASNLTFSGTLDVLNTSIEALEAGDNFQLFSAASYAGTFTSYELPALDQGLAWKTSQLATNGRLWVVSTNPPVINNYNLGDGNFTFSGTGGTPNWNYDVLTTTNLALPVATWSNALSGQFDASGNFNVSLPVNPSTPQQFYLLRAH